MPPRSTRVLMRCRSPVGDGARRSRTSTPGTEYRYRIRSHAETTAHDPSGTGSWHRFTTADPESPDLDFLWFADVQKGLDRSWPALVRAAVDASPDARLSVHSGDLVELPAEDSQWDAWFSGLGAAASGRIVAPVPGNHEGHGDPNFTAFRSNFSLPDNGATDETSYTFD